MKIATPISHLFKDKEWAERIIASSDCLECRDHTIDYNYHGQEVFHSDLQPIHIWRQKEVNYLLDIKKRKTDLKLISFHLATCFDNPTIENHKFVAGGRKLLPEELLSNAIINLNKAKEILGANVLLAIENNNNLGTEAYDYVTEPDFINTVINKNNIWFLFDIAHARISSFYKKMSFEKYANLLPLDRTIQIHISRYGYNDQNEMIDAHELPGENEIGEVKVLLAKYKCIKYLTVEYYKDIEHLLVFLNLVRKELV